MDTHFIKTEGRELIILKVSGNLYLNGHEGEDVQVQVNPREFKVIMDEENILRITCYSNATIAIPKKFRTRVEKIGGSAVIQGIECEDLYVQRVGGNLNVQNVANLDLSRVGGSCQIKSVSGNVNVERVSGDLYMFDVCGSITANSARSDAIVMMARESVNASATGDVVVQYVDPVMKPNNLRSKGDITLIVPENINADLDATFSGWDIVLTMDGKTSNYGGGHYKAVLGEGGTEIKLHASGDIVISDEHPGIVQKVKDEHGEDWFIDYDSFKVDYDVSDAYERRIKRAMAKLEGKLHKAERKVDNASQKMKAQKNSISVRIGERALQRAQRAGKLASLKVQKRAHLEAIEALKEAQIQLKDLDLPIGLPIDFIKDIKIPEIPVIDLRDFESPPEPQAPPAPKTSPEERMMILEMVKDLTITIEEAEKLLGALNE